MLYLVCKCSSMYQSFCNVSCALNYMLYKFCCIHFLIPFNGNILKLMSAIFLDLLNVWVTKSYNVTHSGDILILRQNVVITALKVAQTSKVSHHSLREILNCNLAIFLCPFIRYVIVPQLSINSHKSRYSVV